MDKMAEIYDKNEEEAEFDQLIVPYFRELSYLMENFKLKDYTEFFFVESLVRHWATED